MALNLNDVTPIQASVTDLKPLNIKLPSLPINNPPPKSYLVNDDGTTSSLLQHSADQYLKNRQVVFSPDREQFTVAPSDVKALQSGYVPNFRRYQNANDIAADNQGWGTSTLYGLSNTLTTVVGDSLSGIFRLTDIGTRALNGDLFREGLRESNKTFFGKIADTIDGYKEDALLDIYVNQNNTTASSIWDYTMANVLPTVGQIASFFIPAGIAGEVGSIVGKVGSMTNRFGKAAKYVKAFENAVEGEQELSALLKGASFEKKLNILLNHETGQLEQLAVNATDKVVDQIQLANQFNKVKTLYSTQNNIQKIQGASKLIGSALGSRLVESSMEADETKKKAYSYEFQRLIKENPNIDPSELDKRANQYAEQSATVNFWANMPLIFQDLVHLNSILKPFKFVRSNVVDDLDNLIYKSKSFSEALYSSNKALDKSLLQRYINNSGDKAFSLKNTMNQIGEGLEEVYQTASSNTAVKDNKSVGNNIYNTLFKSDLLSKESIESFMLGVLGGYAFHGIGQIQKAATEKYFKNKEGEDWLSASDKVLKDIGNTVAERQDELQKHIVESLNHVTDNNEEDYNALNTKFFSKMAVSSAINGQLPYLTDPLQKIVEADGKTLVEYGLIKDSTDEDAIKAVKEIAANNLKIANQVESKFEAISKNKTPLTVEIENQKIDIRSAFELRNLAAEVELSNVEHAINTTTNEDRKAKLEQEKAKIQERLNQPEAEFVNEFKNSIVTYKNEVLKAQHEHNTKLQNQAREFNANGYFSLDEEHRNSLKINDAALFENLQATDKENGELSKQELNGNITTRFGDKVYSEKLDSDAKLDRDHVFETIDPETGIKTTYWATFSGKEGTGTLYTVANSEHPNYEIIKESALKELETPNGNIKSVNKSIIEKLTGNLSPDNVEDLAQIPDSNEIPLVPDVIISDELPFEEKSNDTKKAEEEIQANAVVASKLNAISEKATTPKQQQKALENIAQEQTALPDLKVDENTIDADPLIEDLEEPITDFIEESLEDQYLPDEDLTFEDFEHEDDNTPSTNTEVAFEPIEREFGKSILLLSIFNNDIDNVKIKVDVAVIDPNRVYNLDGGEAELESLSVRDVSNIPEDSKLVVKDGRIFAQIKRNSVISDIEQDIIIDSEHLYVEVEAKAYASLIDNNSEIKQYIKDYLLSLEDIAQIHNARGAIKIHLNQKIRLENNDKFVAAKDLKIVRTYRLLIKDKTNRLLTLFKGDSRLSFDKGGMDNMFFQESSTENIFHYQNFLTEDSFKALKEQIDKHGKKVINLFFDKPLYKTAILESKTLDEAKARVKQQKIYFFIPFTSAEKITSYNFGEINSIYDAVLRAQDFYIAKYLNFTGYTIGDVNEGENIEVPNTIDTETIIDIKDDVIPDTVYAEEEDVDVNFDALDDMDSLLSLFVDGSIPNNTIEANLQALGAELGVVFNFNSNVNAYKYLQKVVVLSENRDKFTMTEELAHAISLMLPDSMLNELIGNIKNWKNYKQFYDLYKYKYATEKEVMIEIIGQAIKEAYKLQIENPIKGSIDKFLNKFKGLKTIDKIAEDMINNNNNAILNLHIEQLIENEILTKDC